MGQEWDELFGADTQDVYGIQFEKVQPHEIPKDMKQLKKSTEALQSIKAQASKPKVVDIKEVLEGEAMGGLFKPSDDRKIKNKTEDEDAKLRQIHISSNLLKKFKEHAWPHSPNEYMAWITGTIETDKKTKETICYADGLFFPEQSANEWQCMQSENAECQRLIEHLETRGAQVLGWIHSHPTFSAFFSSIDQHMQYNLQKDSDLAYGLVMDQHGDVRCLRLSPKGLEAVAKCQNHLQVCFVW